MLVLKDNRGIFKLNDRNELTTQWIKKNKTNRQINVHKSQYRKQQIKV